MVTVAQRLRLRMWLCVGRVFQVWLVWRCCWATKRWQYVHSGACHRWAEAPIKTARMTLTIKLDRNWSSFQLANSAPPLSVTDSAIAPSARMLLGGAFQFCSSCHAPGVCFRVWICFGCPLGLPAMVAGVVGIVCVRVRMCVVPLSALLLLGPEGPSKIQEVTLMRPIHGNL